MGVLADDTSADAQAVQLEVLRRLPARRRLEMLDDACRLSRELARVGLRRRHPGASPEVIERLLMDLVLGEELAELAYGPRP